MTRLSHGVPSVPAADLFVKAGEVNPGRVQELMFALHNLKGADDYPALHDGTAITTPLDLIMEALLLLMERVQPGVMGYQK